MGQGKFEDKSYINALKRGYQPTKKCQKLTQKQNQLRSVLPIRSHVTIPGLKQRSSMVAALPGR